MIIPSNDAPVAAQELLERHITESLRAADMDPARASAVAHAVALYCSEVPGPSVYTPDGLALLTAKALSSLGEEHVAAAVMASEPLLDALAGCVRPSQLSPFVVSLVAAGVVRPLRWPAMSAGLTVVLDLRRVRRDNSWMLELAYLPSMHRLADACAELWVGFGGEGVLAIHGLREHERNLAAIVGPEAGLGLRGEVVQATRERLAHAAVRRRWSRAPRIIELD